MALEIEMTRRKMEPLEQLRLVFAWTAFALWAGSILVDAVWSSFDVHPSVTAMAAAAATMLFGLPLVRRGDSGDKGGGGS